MNFFEKILNIFFPDTCVGCGSRGVLLCARCTARLSPAEAPMETFITSVFSYKDFRIKRLIWLLKYRNARRAAAHFAPPLAQALTEILGEESLFLGGRPVLIVPIPLSKKRKQKRGYNQSELLAREMLEHMPKGQCVLDTKLVRKIIDTTPQADIKNKNDRLRNLGDCYEVLPGRMGQGEAVVLIDDVTTTGATLSAARKALRAAGFRKVYALTVAH